ncbi:MAG TPA: hypothetical protein VFY49_07285, partial [Myxococcota bacterium]|nr:hypothetical protein [Myxococcota bacterium]
MKALGCMLGAAALAAALYGVGALAADEPAASLASLLEREAPISAPAPGAVRLVLTPEVIQSCRPDLSDLRVFDAAGREVAFLVDSLRLDEALEVTETFGGEVRGLRRELTEPEHGPAVTSETYVLAAPPREPAAGTWELVFESQQPRFVREISVYQGGEGEGPALVANEPIFRLDAQTRRLRVPLPPLGEGVLRVEIAGREGFYLEPTLRFEGGRRIEAAEQSAVPLEEIAREKGDGRTVVQLARPSGLVPALLRVETRTGTLRRSVSVYDEQQGSDDRRLGTGTVYRLAGGKAESLIVHLRPALGERLRVEIEDGDSPALEGLAFHAVIRQPALVFELPADATGNASGTLRFGGGRVRRAHYDLDAFAPRSGQTGEQAAIAAQLADGSWLPLATLGPIRANPDFDRSPALAFAMHAGAELDPRTFSHRRSLEISPSPEGLSRVALAPEDAALLRADLADLRIVDDDAQQWPYLLSAREQRKAVPLQMVAGTPEKRHTTIRLQLPAAPLRVERVALRSSIAFFDRPFELSAEDEHGRQRVVAHGRLVKQALRPGPVTIPLGGEAVHALVLRVDDGDDAPLAFVEASADVLLPEVFVVAPEGRYEMLLGNPDVPAPRYELERVRDVVLAAGSNAAAPGALEENPSFSLRARLGGDGGPSGLLRTSVV